MKKNDGMSERGAKLIGEETSRKERRPYLAAFHLFVRNDKNRNEDGLPWTQAVIIREFLVLWSESPKTSSSYDDFVVDHYTDVTRLRNGSGGGDSPFLFELVRRFLSKHFSSMPKICFTRTLRTLAADLDAILEPSRFPSRARRSAKHVDIRICCPAIACRSQYGDFKSQSFIAFKTPNREAVCCAAIAFSLDSTEVHLGLYNIISREFLAREPTRPEYYKYVIMRSPSLYRSPRFSSLKPKDEPFKGTFILDVFVMTKRPGVDQALDFARQYFTYLDFDI